MRPPVKNHLLPSVLGPQFAARTRPLEECHLNLGGYRPRMRAHTVGQWVSFALRWHRLLADVCHELPARGQRQDAAVTHHLEGDATAKRPSVFDEDGAAN